MSTPQLTVGVAALWDTATWGGSTTWSPVTLATDTATRFAENPATGAGASLSPTALGGLRLVVQALNPVGAIDTIWDTALWDTALWSASVGSWQDISSRVRGLTFTVGSGDPGSKGEVGVAQVTLDNLDGLASPFATSGAFVGSSQRSWLRAGCVVRLGVLVNTPGELTGYARLGELAAFEALFTGTIESVDDQVSENTDAFVTLNLVETGAFLAATATTPQTVLDGDTVAQTIYAALVNSGWQYSTAMYVPKVTTPLVNQNVFNNEAGLGIIGRAVDSANWDIRYTGRGGLAIVPRTDDTFETGLVFVNYADPAVPGTYLHVPMAGATVYSSTDRVFNTAVAANEGGIEVGYTNSASAAQFGPITNRYGFPRNDLILQNIGGSNVVSLLTEIVGAHAQDDLGISGIALNADMDATLMPAALLYVASYGRLGASIEVKYHHPSGTSLDYGLLVIGQTHSITPQGPGVPFLWTASLNTAVLRPL